jgi:dimeric dUTPase (all-alpha-NTP-PPase superfamily)
MKLEFDILYSQQLELDKRIESEHQLEAEELFDRKVLALLVELGELANETRCFKFWSKKPASEKSVILEEYVDGIHFILSLGIELDYKIPASFENITSETSLTDQFLLLYRVINQFKVIRSLANYQLVLEHFLLLGTLLDITGDDVMEAYFKKNQTNHERQENGY